MALHQSLLVEKSCQYEYLCLPSDRRIHLGLSENRSRLAQNEHIEAFLQGVILVGPTIFLLALAPLRLYQLHNAKLVAKPNSRGVVKVMSELLKCTCRPGCLSI